MHATNVHQVLPDVYTTQELLELLRPAAHRYVKTKAGPKAPGRRGKSTRSTDPPHPPGDPSEPQRLSCPAGRNKQVEKEEKRCEGLCLGNTVNNNCLTSKEACHYSTTIDLPVPPFPFCSTTLVSIPTLAWSQPHLHFPLKHQPAKGLSQKTLPNSQNCQHVPDTRYPSLSRPPPGASRCCLLWNVRPQPLLHVPRTGADFLTCRATYFKVRMPMYPVKSNSLLTGTHRLASELVRHFSRPDRLDNLS